MPSAGRGELSGRALQLLLWYIVDVIQDFVMLVGSFGCYPRVFADNAIVNGHIYATELTFLNCRLSVSVFDPKTLPV